MRYSIKLLTLTVPGRIFRRRYTPLEAYDQMAHNFDKLIRATKKRYGQFNYIRVVEPHRDGFPHFHIILVGDAIRPISVLPYIEALWRGKYKMGFVKMNVSKNPFNDGIHAIRYITKYMTKDLNNMGKNKRIFTASQGALMPRGKRDTYKSEIVIGTVLTDENGGTYVHEEKIGDMFLHENAERWRLSPTARAQCRDDENWRKLQRFCAEHLHGMPPHLKREE